MPIIFKSSRASSSLGAEVTMVVPFTVGKWKESRPVTITLKEGENTLRFWRNRPPQYGLAIKDFTLTPVE